MKRLSLLLIILVFLSGCSPSDTPEIIYNTELPSDSGSDWDPRNIITQRIESIIKVSGMTGWQSTNIVVSPGQSVQINYLEGQWAGRVGYEPELPDIWTDAWGTDQEIYYDEIGISSNFGGLIAKIGDSLPFYVGGDYQFTSDSSGILYLRMHESDGGFNDNEGSIVVSIIILNN